MLYLAHATLCAFTLAIVLAFDLSPSFALTYVQAGNVYTADYNLSASDCFDAMRAIDPINLPQCNIETN